MKTKTKENNASYLLKRHGKGIILQTIVFFVMLTSVMVWEPIVLNMMFSVLETENARALAYASIIGIVVVTIMFVFAFINNTYADINTFRVINSERKASFKQLIRLKYQEVNEHFKEGDLFDRIEFSGMCRFMIWMDVVYIVIYTTALLILIKISFSIVAWFIFLVGGVVLLEAGVVRLKTQIVLRYENAVKEFEAASDEESRMLVSNFLLLKMNALETEKIEQYLQLRQRNYQKQTRMEVMIAVCDFMVYILSMFCRLLLAVLLLPRSLAGSVSSGIIMASFSTFDALKNITSGISQSITKLIKDYVPLHRVQELFAYTRDYAPGKEGSPLVSVEQVSLSFEERSLFKDLDFSVQKGEKVAIIGLNGSGKSTLLRMILGLQTASSGEIYVNGERADYQGNNFLEAISYVPAKPYLFHGTAMQNMQMASKKNQVADMDFIDAELAKNTIDGLSGGEQQRINIARGIYKNAAIYIADEPTSNLNDELAHRVMEQLLREDTLLVVTHHYEMLPLFSRVVVIGQGGILADGPWDDVRDKVQKNSYFE